MKVTLPVEFKAMFVKLLLLIFWERVAAVLLMYRLLLAEEAAYTIPLISFVRIVTAAAALPPVLEMPVTAPVVAALKLTKLPEAFPNWLLLIVTAAVTAPVFTMPETVPVAVVPVELIFRIIFPEILNVPTGKTF